MAVETIQTKFGTHDANLDQIAGRRITVLLENLVFPVGHQMVSGTLLKESEVVPAGAVIRRTTRHEGMTHEIVERGLWDALSGEERAYRGGNEHETEEVRVHRGAVKCVSSELSTWVALTPEERVQVTKLLESSAASLRYVVNSYKRRAYELINSASNEKDRRGRPNPGKRRAELAAADRKLYLRLEEVRAIYPYLSSDLLGMRTYLEEIHDRYDALKKLAEFWKKKFATPDEVSLELRRNMWQTATETRKWVSDIVVLPYRLSVPRLVELLSIDNLQCEEFSTREVYDHWGMVIRIVASQVRRRELLEKNIQLGLAEASKVPSESVYRHLMPLCKSTVEAMARCLSSIREEDRPFAMEIFYTTKAALKSYRAGDPRNFRKVRKGIKEFSELMI